MDKLKVGDKVYRTSSLGFTNFTQYQFSEVIRLTNTQAVLKNGVRLVNEPRMGFTDSIGFSEHGQRFAMWYPQNDEILQEAKAEAMKVKIYNWFFKRKFTEEEKAIIYKTFESLNKL